MEESEYILELKSSSKQRLSMTNHDKYWLLCAVKGCNRKTEVRDYGIAPIYHTRLRGGWVNLDEIIFLCGTHYKPFQKNKLQFIYKDGPASNHIIHKI